ncbi:hypothetical protein C8Q78DRAFT_490065 [Trametes maxima]|nr:hypothetical protein C8Q78DRAFT_490065 [Trametes maxima]
MSSPGYNCSPPAEHRLPVAADHPAHCDRQPLRRIGINPALTLTLSFPHLIMIVAELLVVCFLALVGVLQQGSTVDALFSALSRLNTPALTPVPSLLQVTGANSRLALDAVPLKEVGQGSLLHTAILGDDITNHITNLSIIEKPLVLDLDLSSSLFNNVTETFTATFGSVPGIPTLVPAPLWYQMANLTVRIGLLCLAFRICQVIRGQLCLYYSGSDKLEIPTLQHAISASRALEHNRKILHPETKQQTRLLQRTPPADCSNTLSHGVDPLYRVFSASILQELYLLSRPPSSFISPSTSTASHTACTHAHQPRVFGTLCSQPFGDDDDGGSDDTSYLRDALGLIEPSVEPIRGWLSEDAPDGARPTQDELDLWMLPGTEVDLAERTVVIGDR